MQSDNLARSIKNISLVFSNTSASVLEVAMLLGTENNDTSLIDHTYINMSRVKNYSTTQEVWQY